MGNCWQSTALQSCHWPVQALSAREVLHHVQQRWSQPQPKDRIFFSLLSQIPSTSFKPKIYMIQSWVLPQNFKTKNFFTTFTTTQIYIQNLHNNIYSILVILQPFILQLYFILVIFILFNCNVKFIFLATAEEWCSHYGTDLSS